MFRHSGPLAFIVLWAATAQAQSSIAEIPESVKAEGGRHFDAGYAAFARGDFEKAYVEYLACYGLVPSLSTLANLGMAEVKTGRFVDGARHLREFLRRKRLERNESDPADAAAAEHYEQALAKIGRLALQVNELDARVYVNGQFVQVTPLPEEWLGKAGEHVVRVEKVGFLPVERHIVLLAGVLIKEHIQLEPTTAPVAVDSAAAPQGYSAAQDVRLPPSSPEERSPLPVKPIVLIGGVAVTVLAGGAALLFGLQGEAARDRTTDERNRLRREYGDRACTFQPGRCRALYEARDDRAAANRAANISMTVAATSLAATAAAFFFWPESKPRGSAVTPWWSPSALGATWEGRF